MKKLILYFLSLLCVTCGKNESHNEQGNELNQLSRVDFDGLVAEGRFLKKDFPIGFWKYYDSEKRLLEVKEFFNIGNKPYLNQNWIFDLKGDTIPRFGYYYEIKFEKDTISLSHPLKALVNLKEAFFKERPSSIMVLLPQNNSPNFNADFSNMSEVIKDTIFNLNMEREYREQAELTGDYRRSVLFGSYFDTAGLKKIRGIIVEFNSDKEYSDAIKGDYKERYYYFEKDIFVKEE